MTIIAETWNAGENPVKAGFATPSVLRLRSDKLHRFSVLAGKG